MFTLLTTNSYIAATLISACSRGARNV